MNEAERKARSELMAALGEMVDRAVHGGRVPDPGRKTHGFVLITFPLGETESINFVSNATLESMSTILEETQKSVARNLENRRKAH